MPESTPFGIDLDLLVLELGALLTGVAAVVGMWVARDRDRPTRYAIALTGLIGLATIASMFQTKIGADRQAKLEEQLADVLQRVDAILQKEDVVVPSVNDLVKEEITTENRAAPKVVDRMARKVAANGGNPADVLGSYLPAADVQAMQREKRLAAGNVAAGATPRRDVEFGGAPAHPRGPAKTPAAPTPPNTSPAPSSAAGTTPTAVETP